MKTIHLFPSEVLAIRENRKTQLLALVSKRNSDCGIDWNRLEFDAAKVPDGALPTFADDGYLHVACRPHPKDPQAADFWTRWRVYPVWSVGDRLWVREAAYYWQGGAGGVSDVAYLDDPELPQLIRDQAIVDQAKESNGNLKEFVGNWEKRSASQMPRWASRVTLEVTAANVEPRKVGAAIPWAWVVDFKPVDCAEEA